MSLQSLTGNPYRGWDATPFDTETDPRWEAASGLSSFRLDCLLRDAFVEGHAAAHAEATADQQARLSQAWEEGFKSGAEGERSRVARDVLASMRHALANLDSAENELSEQVLLRLGKVRSERLTRYVQRVRVKVEDLIDDFGGAV